MPSTTAIFYERRSELFQCFLIHEHFPIIIKSIIVSAMKRLEAMGASCFILDLRDNLGGLVQVFKMVL